MIFDADLEKSVWSESVTIVNFSEQNSRRGKYMYESECISYENIWIECYSTCSWCDDDDYDDDDLSLKIYNMKLMSVWIDEDQFDNVINEYLLQKYAREPKLSYKATLMKIFILSDMNVFTMDRTE